MKKNLEHVFRILLLIIPLLLGVFGFTSAGEPLTQALYKGLCLYGMGHDALPENLWVEIARWLAPLATMSGFVMAFSALRQWWRVFLAQKSRQSTVVFGDPVAKELLLKELGNSGIDVQDTPVKAHRYFLLGSEAENLEFYRKNRSILAGKEVYLQCDALPVLAGKDPKLHLFCPETAAASLFWDTYPLPYSMTDYPDRDNPCKVVLLGFGKLGRELLLHALKNNIYHPDQYIEYHIFGLDKGFYSMHWQLSQISDRVFFYTTPWYDCLPLLDSAARIIVVQQHRQLSLLSDLRFTLPKSPLYVLDSQAEGNALLSDQDNIFCCHWKTQVLTLDYITNRSLEDCAKRIFSLPADYWEQLDADRRARSLENAAFIQKYAQVVDVQDQAQMDLLVQLDHIRWSRGLYLDNWRYGPLDYFNGRPRRADYINRTHCMLMPYDCLSPEDHQFSKDSLVEALELSKHPDDIPCE